MLLVLPEMVEDGNPLCVFASVATRIIFLKNSLKREGHFQKLGHTLFYSQSFFHNKKYGSAYMKESLLKVFL
jgi:hypothetical protein